MPKHSTLGDNAEIYQPRKKQTEKEKLHDLPFKKKATYLWEYYRTHAFIFIAVIALTSYIIYTIVTPKVETKFYAAIINSAIDTQVLTDYGADFSKHLQLDPKKEEIILNSSFYFSGEADFNLRQALATFIATSEVDVIIAPESEFASFAANGFMNKLSDQLPTDLYASMTDRFYFSDVVEDPESNAYGIYLSDCGLFKDYTNIKDPYILGILVNAPNKNNTIEFIRYLFELYP